jgi:N-formylglutamate amidohydrolase
VAALAEEGFGFSVHNINVPQFPVLLSVPHAGREYPPEIFDNLRLPPSDLLRLEDRYADLLARKAVTDGFPTIIAHKARAWIDLNRDEADIDVAMVEGLRVHARPTPGAKQRGGLGLIPRRLSGAGDIWKRPILAEDLQHRITQYHRPYHAQIAAILSAMRDRFGVAILLDLHSMPPLAQTLEQVATGFVIGDRFGRSAANRFSEVIMAQLRLHGHGAALNHPYSGEYILRRHGDGGRNIHALQLEVNRALYLDDLLREPSQGIQSISKIVTGLLHTLSNEAFGDRTLLAAE